MKEIKRDKISKTFENFHHKTTEFMDFCMYLKCEVHEKHEENFSLPMIYSPMVEISYSYSYTNVCP